MADYSPLDDAMLDAQAVLWSPDQDRAATVVVATFTAAISLANARAAFFGEPQRVRQVRDVRLLELRLGVAWTVTAA